MKKLLIVVDYQNDFVTGALGFEGATKFEEPIAKKIKEYRSLGENGEIIFTMDTHGEDYLNTQEGKKLPLEHCIDGQEGWQLYGKIADLKEPEDLMFSKPTFGSYELGEYLHKNADKYESVELVGLVTNMCVISNAVLAKAAMPNVPILVEENCVGSNDESLQQAALNVMESFHIEIKR